MSENRNITEAPVELREEGGKPRIMGYAIVFNSLSVDLGGYREIVTPGALDATLADIQAGKASVLARLQHNGGIQLIGRTENGSLTLEKDSKGVKYTITPPDTQAGRDAVALVRDGYITKSSFAFSLRQNGASWDYNTNPPTRYLQSINLHDVAPVDTPAYTATLAEVRSAGKSVVESSRRPAPTGKSRIEIRERENGGKWAEVYLLDEIVPSYFAKYLGSPLMGSQQVIEALAAVPDAERIDVYINSPGGDAFEGIAIMNTLKDHPAPVNIFVRGLAASAASIIAMAGDSIQMGEGSFMMIHNSATVARGQATTLHKTAMLLEKLDEEVAGVYARRTKNDQKQIAKMMSAETWLSAGDAVEKGFADRMSGAVEQEARWGELCRGMEYRNIPEALGGPGVVARVEMTDEDLREATARELARAI